MPATRKPTTRKPTRTTAKRKPAAPKESAALRRLNRSLDSAQDALTRLRKDVGKDVSAGSNSLYNDLKRFVKDARRDSGKLAKALQRDAEKAQARMKGTTQTKATSRKRSPSPKRSPARKRASR